MHLLEIAVAAPIVTTLTYRLPQSLCSEESCESVDHLIGRRVLVPLGRRKVTGYVFGRTNAPEGNFKLRDIAEILDVQPLFHLSIIPVFRWIADYYHHPIGEVVKTALPAGLNQKTVRFLRCPNISDLLQNFGEAGKEEDWLRILCEAGQLSPSMTKELLHGDAVQRRMINKFITSGLLVLDEKRTSDLVKDKVETCYCCDGEMERTLSALHTAETDLAHFREAVIQQQGEQLKLSEVKTIYYLSLLGKDRKGRAVPKKELAAHYSGASKALKSLVEKGIVRQEVTRVFRSPLGEQLEYYPAPEQLTQEQQTVMDKLRPALQSRKFQPILLHGVTGSGKTEVYLQAAQETLAAGRSVLVIVPEIALATQLEAHFISRFGEQVVLLHSGLSPAERYDQWSLAMTGQASIVIGARSAVFAPLPDPGLIVVDEEHDHGLKQEDSLRYHGRDVAVVRAKIQKCTVLLSSATPSVVSYNNALTGKYQLLEMKKRVADRPLPAVTLIDLRDKLPGKKQALFRPPLERALKENLRRHKQSVILLNRRGFSANVLCQECGEAVQCRDCHVSLTMHKARQQLLCHYCGYSVNHMTVCDKCGSTSMIPIGFGTERVEEELRALLPEARIARLDTDTASNRKEYLQTLKDMRSGAIDVLVGTQMVAKGHHFPGVTLVGVVWADGGLNIPDFRAAERTFQLVTQVTGRAGRGDDPGEVFIQTMRPEHYAIQFARDHLYKDLVIRELNLRKNPAFPPFVRLAAVHIHGEHEGDVQAAATRIAAACRSITAESKGNVEILGPVPSPIDRVKRKYRWQVMVKGQSNALVHSICSYIQANSADLASSRCRVIIDVDPESMM